MTWIAGLFLPGKRTFTATIIFLTCGLALQLDMDEVIHLSPIFKISINYILYLAGGLVPIFLRKGVNSALNEKAKS